MSRKGKSIETERKLAVTWGQTWEWGVTASRDKVSFRSDENTHHNSVNLLKITELDTKIGECYGMCLSLLRQEYHRLGGINNRHLFSDSSGSWKSDNKVSGEWISWQGCKERSCSESLSLTCRWPSSPFIFVPSSLYMPVSNILFL